LHVIGYLNTFTRSLFRMNLKLTIFLLLLNSAVWSQTADSVSKRTVPVPLQDSLSSAVKDSAKKSRSDIDAVIYSSGSDSLIFYVDVRKLEIYGRGELKYKTTVLKSENIAVDFNLNEVQAGGRVDTADTAKIKLKGTPVMSEAGEVYMGEKLSYNFKTQRGLISVAKNKAEGSLYSGSRVKKMSRDTYFIKDGAYTTCNADTSHFFFAAKEMKVVLKEQIIAKWIWLYIGGVPLPVPLPFGVFPNETGRRSGIITPAYGQSAAWGRYFSHLGYFWAMNDYMDMNLLSDIYLRGGYNLSSSIRYAKRYSLNGNIRLGYSGLHTGFKSDPSYNENSNWQIAVNHNQRIDPNTQLDANLMYISSKAYINNTSYTRNDALTQQITSNANLFHSFEESGNSLSLGYQRTQILNSADTTQIGNITETLPSLSFNMSQSYPFRKKKGYDPARAKWYDLIGYSYSGQLQNEHTVVHGESDSRAGIQHSVAANASPKAGYFSISPVINYTEKWYSKITEAETVPNGSYNGKADTTFLRDKDRISAVRYFSFGIGASTRLYGIVQPRVFGVEAVRHTLSPSISYNYTPDFSTPAWGYYGNYTDDKGRTIKYDKYQKGIYGGAPQSESQTINFNLDNNLELKTQKDPGDTTSESKKIQIIHLTASTNYNFAPGIERRLGDMYLNYRTQIAGILDLNGTSSYSFYDFDYTTMGISNSYLASRQGGGLLRLTRFSLSAGINLSAEKLKGFTDKNAEDRNQPVFPQLTGQRSEYTGLNNEVSPDYSIPWDLSLSLTYNTDKSNPLRQTKATNIYSNVNFNLTPSLKVSATGNYDVQTKQFLYPEVRIYKDLHCWEMNFTWNPTGSWQGYRFEIRIKASQLRDIKLERSRGQYSGR